MAQTHDNGIYKHIADSTKDFHGNKMKLFIGPSITFSIDNPEAIFIQNKPFFTSNIMRVLHAEGLKTNHYFFFMEFLKKQTSSFNWAFKFSGPVVLNLDINLPSKKNALIKQIDFKEISLIGSVFNHLDSLITLHQRVFK